MDTKSVVLAWLQKEVKWLDTEGITYTVAEKPGKDPRIYFYRNGRYIADVVFLGGQIEIYRESWGILDPVLIMSVHDPFFFYHFKKQMTWLAYAS